MTAMRDTMSKRKQEEQGQQEHRKMSFDEVLTSERKKQSNDTRLEGRTFGYDKQGVILYYQMARREYV